MRDFVRALAVFAVCAMIYAWWTAGSLRHITDVLQGQRIVLDPPAIPALLATPGELVQVPLRICNLTRSPIKVTGASANCSCVRPGDLPVDIAPHGEVIINLSWHVPAELGQAQESIQYYFSQDETWSQPVTLVADVVASDDGAAGL